MICVKITVTVEERGIELFMSTKEFGGDFATLRHDFNWESVYRTFTDNALDKAEKEQKRRAWR